MTIGLKRGVVKLMPYDPRWQNEFESEKHSLVEAFGNKIIAVEHIGSTSLPGAYAKPIIDLQVGIRSLDEATDFIAGLEKLGYEYVPEEWFADRCFFPKGTDECITHHLHLVEFNGAEWTNSLLFRDYLIAHPQALKEYVALKEDLAERYENDRHKYTEAKDAFINSVLQKAK